LQRLAFAVDPRSAGPLGGCSRRCPLPIVRERHVKPVVLEIEDVVEGTTATGPARLAAKPPFDVIVTALT